jgi:hypothetical protein
VTLDELAIKHNTDKGSQFHHYTRWYERHFRSFVGTDVTIVEIGICESYSLLMWREYFGPKARVIGVDYSAEYCTKAAGLGFEVICGAQEDPTVLAQIAALRPQIVIDDGGHQGDAQRTSFNVLFPQLSDGSIYVIEDLHAAFWGWGGNLVPTLHAIADGAMDRGVSSFGDLRHDHVGGLEKLSPIEQNTQAVHFYPSIMFVEKNFKGRR